MLAPYGHVLVPAGAAGHTAAEIGAATGDRVRAAWAAHRGGRAGPARRRVGNGGATASSRPPYRGGVTQTPTQYAEISTPEELVELLGEPHQRARDKERTDAARRRPRLAGGVAVLRAGDDRCRRQHATPRPRATRPGSLVHVIDDRTIAIAERPGNRRADGYQNILANPHVGLNFLIPGRGDTLRINGRARLVQRRAVLRRDGGQGPPAAARRGRRHRDRSSSTARRRSCARGSGSRRPGTPRPWCRGGR